MIALHVIGTPRGTPLGHGGRPLGEGGRLADDGKRIPCDGRFTRRIYEEKGEEVWRKGQGWLEAVRGWRMTGSALKAMDVVFLVR